MPYTALNFLVWTTTHHESAMFANLLSAPGLLPLVQGNRLKPRIRNTITSEPIRPYPDLFTASTQSAEEPPDRRKIRYIHGAENGRVHAMGKHARELASQARNVTVRTFYNAPDPGDEPGRHYD